jgi:hypothetical protein
MKNVKITAALLVLASAVPAAAQQINGATVSGAFQSVEGDFTGDADITSFTAGLDYGITPQFAIGGSIESIMSDDFTDDIFVATARGMYITDGGPAFGVYYSLDQFSDFETTLYGVEGAYRSANGSFEAYIGGADSDVFGTNDVLRTAGFSFEYGVGAGVFLGLDYQSYKVADSLLVIDTGDIVDANVTDMALTARYSFLEGASVYGKLGVIRAFGDGEEAFDRVVGIDESEYVAIGAQYDFENGALFDPRTLFTFGG